MMDKTDLEKLILSFEAFEAPAVQREAGVSYGELKAVLERLLAIGKIRFVSGVSYEVCPDSAKILSPYEPKSDLERDYITALWECVKNENAEPSFIQRKLGVSYRGAGRARDWMKQHKFVAPLGEVLITKEEFIKKFGDPEDEKGDDARQRGHLQFDFPFVEDDDSENPALDFELFQERLDELIQKNQEKNSDGDDARADRLRRYLNEKKDEPADIDDELDSFLRELDEEFPDGEDDDDEEDGDGEVTAEADVNSLLRDVFSDCLQLSLKSGEQGKYFIVNEAQKPEFEISFVKNGDAMRISDCGETVKNSDQTTRRIKNLLKGYPPVRLDENGELFVEFDGCFGVLFSLMTLYAAVDAVKKMK